MRKKVYMVSENESLPINVTFMRRKRTIGPNKIIKSDQRSKGE